jgi:hypothetical protein
VWRFARSSQNKSSSTCHIRDICSRGFISSMTRYKFNKRICSTKRQHKYFTPFFVFDPLQDGPGRWILDAQSPRALWRKHLKNRHRSDSDSQQEAIKYKSYEELLCIQRTSMWTLKQWFYNWHDMGKRIFEFWIWYCTRQEAPICHIDQTVESNTHYPLPSMPKGIIKH